MNELTLKALAAAAPTLAEGIENCGGDADCIWFEPLQLIRQALAALYVECIGYNPFADDPAMTEQAVAQTLLEWMAAQSE